MRIPIFVSMLGANVTLVAISVASLVGLSVREFRADKETYVFDFASQVAEGLAQQVGSQLEAERKKLELLNTVLLDPTRTPAQRKELAESMFVHFPEVARFEARRKNETPLFLYNRTLLRKSGFASSELFDKKRREPDPPGIGGEMTVSPQPLSEDLVALSLVFDAGGVRVSGDIIEPALTGPFLAEGAVPELFLVDARGRVMLHHELSRVGTDLSGSPIVQQALKRNAGSMGFKDLEGRAWLGAYAPVATGGLAIFSQVSEDQAYAAGNRLVKKSLLAGAGLLLLMSLAAVIVAGRFSVPLVRMSKLTELVASGDFKGTVPDKAQNELGDLARSLNKMGAELLARDDRITQQQQALVASEKMAAFGTLGAGIAHEVKNPLAGIQGAAELAMRKIKADDPVYKYLAMINKETRRCTEIIGGLLKFARREKVEFLPVDLNEVVADTYKLANHPLSLKMVSCDLVLKPDLPMVSGNANQLQQVLLNLALNAGDAMPTGGKVTFITATTLLGEVEVRVSDTGTGMSEEVRAKIFDPFFTTKDPGKGTGLGLSVTYGIVKDHQATISVASAVGKGTTFVLLFPRDAKTAALARQEEVRATAARDPGQAGKAPP